MRQSILVQVMLALVILAATVPARAQTWPGPDPTIETPAPQMPDISHYLDTPPPTAPIADPEPLPAPVCIGQVQVPWVNGPACP